MKDLQELTRFCDRFSFLFLEKGHIEQHQSSVAYVTEKETVPIPAASLALLMLGPGTTITHAAIHNLADCNCLVVWCGEEGARFYSHGRGGTFRRTSSSARPSYIATPAPAPLSCGGCTRNASAARWSPGCRWSKSAVGKAIECVTPTGSRPSVSR